MIGFLGDWYRVYSFDFAARVDAEMLLKWTVNEMPPFDIEDAPYIELTEEMVVREGNDDSEDGDDD